MVRFKDLKKGEGILLENDWFWIAFFYEDEDRFLEWSGRLGETDLDHEPMSRESAWDNYKDVVAKGWKNRGIFYSKSNLDGIVVANKKNIVHEPDEDFMSELEKL